MWLSSAASTIESDKTNMNKVSEDVNRQFIIADDANLLCEAKRLKNYLDNNGFKYQYAGSFQRVVICLSSHHEELVKMDLNFANIYDFVNHYFNWNPEEPVDPKLMSVLTNYIIDRYRSNEPFKQCTARQKTEFTHDKFSSDLLLELVQAIKGSQNENNFENCIICGGYRNEHKDGCKLLEVEKYLSKTK